MNNQRLLTEAFRQLTSSHLPYEAIVPGEVTAVEKTSCSVRFLRDEVVVDGIRLKTTPNEEEDFFIHYPQVGSKVLVGLMDEDYEGIVLACDAVDEIRYQREDTRYVCNKEKLFFSLEASSTTFLVGEQVVIAREGVSFSIEDEAVVKKGDTRLSVGDKILLEKGGISLRAILQEIKDVLNQIVSTPIPPSAGAPAGLMGLPPPPPNPPLTSRVASLNTKIDTLLA